MLKISEPIIVVLYSPYASAKIKLPFFVRQFLHCSLHSNSGSTASCTNFASSIVLQFHVLHFHVLHFQRPRLDTSPDQTRGWITPCRLTYYRGTV